MSVITLKNVSKIYGKEHNTKVEALKPTTFEIEKGQFVCIIGTSGSGKSTLLHLLAGVDQVTNGEIWINGINMSALDTDEKALFRRKEIGIIYQFFNLIPVLTARKNIELPLRLDKKAINQDYFNELVKLLGIVDRVDFLPNKLSGGEQQRVAIARSLIHQPSIILADEPTGNLNSKLAKEVMDFLVLACKQYYQTIVMITHDLEIAKFADRIIEIQDGSIVKDFMTYEGLELNEETSDFIDKEAIIKKAQERLDKINLDYKPVEVAKYEGVEVETGNYHFDYEKMKTAFNYFYLLDGNNRMAKKEIELPNNIEIYYLRLKEALDILEQGNFVLLINLKKKKVVKQFETKDLFIDYINSFDQIDYLLTDRKEELLKRLNIVKK